MNEEFTEIVQRHRDAMLATALRVTGRAVLAEEATQEAFVTLHRSFDKLRDRDTLGPWLKVTVRRIARDMIRRERVQTSPILGEREGKTERPGERLQDAEATGYALTALAALPLRDRELLMASVIGDATIETLADYFHTSPTVIKGRLQRARERLATTGSSLQAIEKALRKNEWPTSYAKRCRLSAEARQAVIEAFWHWAKSTRGAITMLNREPLDRAYEACQRALTLDPYGATNHALACQICTCLALYQRLSQLSRKELDELGGLGDLIGTVPKAMLQQARVHAEAAERLNPKDLESVRAISEVLIWDAPSRDELPLQELAELADRAVALAPGRLDVVGEVMFIAALGNREPDVTPFLRALVALSGKPLDHPAMSAAFGTVRLMLRMKKPAAARAILEAIRDRHKVPNELEEDFRHQLATYEEQLRVLEEDS